MNVSELNAYFQRNRKKIIENNIGKYAVIYKNKVKGYFESDQEAISFCSENSYELGKFLIKHCLKKEDEIQRFYSRVSFH